MIRVNFVAAFNTIYGAIKRWLVNNGDEVAEAILVSMMDAAKASDAAYAVVSQIDEELKPELRDENCSVIDAVDAFLAARCDEFELIRKQAEELAALPRSEMLAGIALFVLRRTPGVKHLSQTALEGGIRVAYGAYQILRDGKK